MSRFHTDRAQLPCPPAVVRATSSTSHNHGSIHSGRHRHGNNEPTQQSIPNLPTHLRRRLPRSSSREHGVCHILLHQLGAGYQVLFRSQTRPLHEDSPTPPLLRSDGCHTRIQYHPNWCIELDVRVHSKHLHSTSDQWLHLPHCKGTLQRQYSMGCCWSAEVLRNRGTLQTTCMGVLSWGNCSDRGVADR